MVSTEGPAMVLFLDTRIVFVNPGSRYMCAISITKTL